MDIYWFQGGELNSKVAEFFDRLEPVYRNGHEVRKGVVLCAGWLCDSVLLWNGNMSDAIYCCQPPLYEVWTYERLSLLVQSLKTEAEKRKLFNFHVALMLVGWKNLEFDETQCEGWSGRTEDINDKPKYNIKGKWLVEHSEVYDSRYGVFYLGAKILEKEEDTIYSMESLTFGEYFSEKLCHMSKSVGLDAVVFRDGIFTPAYMRGSHKRYMDVQDRDELNQSIIELFRRIKSNMPDFIIIGYSSGTSPIEEWRSHGFDLEKVAMSGYLDIWITQTWASAWQDYWPCHSMGYTFQLSNVLVNQAMLVNTPCKHIFLIETFDAWEPWDSIHQYPSKVKWEMWAYSHSGVVKPGGGIQYSSGYYISWMNHGKELLPEETVEYIVSSLKEIGKDLELGPVPGGPCLVYDRVGFEKLFNTPESYSRGEEIDDWSAMLLKYGTPILSITRSEWMQHIEADGFICPTVKEFTESQAETLVEVIKKGTAILFVGQAALLSECLKENLIVRVLPKPLLLCNSSYICSTEAKPYINSSPDKIINDFGVPILEKPYETMLSSCAAACPELVKEIGASGLVINQCYRTLDEGDDWITLLEVFRGPVFVKNKQYDCWIWEPPEWGTLNDMNLSHKSVQSLQTFFAISLTVNENGWGEEKIKWKENDWQKPVCFQFWRYPSGEIGVLLGNLESGITGNSQFCTKGNLFLKAVDEKKLVGKGRFSYGRIVRNNDNIQISLGAHKACQFSIK